MANELPGENRLTKIVGFYERWNSDDDITEEESDQSIRIMENGYIVHRSEENNFKYSGYEDD